MRSLLQVRTAQSQAAYSPRLRFREGWAAPTLNVHGAYTSRSEAVRQCCPLALTSQRRGRAPCNAAGVITGEGRRGQHGCYGSELNACSGGVNLRRAPQLRFRGRVASFPSIGAVRVACTHFLEADKKHGCAMDGFQLSPEFDQSGILGPCCGPPNPSVRDAAVMYQA